MLLTDISYRAADVEARALRGPSWARPYDAKPAANGGGPRGLVGHALMGLGRLIAAEASPATAQLRAGR